MGALIMNIRLFLFSALILALSSVITETEAAAQCKTFSKGAFDGGVTSSAQCRTACEKAEGCTKEFNGVLQEYSTKDCDGAANPTCKCQCAKDSWRTVCGTVCSGVAGLQ